MSNLIINIRILDWHFQVSNSCRWRVVKNDYHSTNKYPHGLWCIYKFFNWIEPDDL
jgi:hypothetical protein